ncbi:MAG: hypothetical protein ACP5PQ_00915 [Thermoproteota archaeon]
MGQRTGDYGKEYSIWQHQVEREYLEEVFEYKELKTPPITTTYMWYKDKPELKYLQSLIEEKKAGFYLTGVAVNLLNLRPEICTLLLINTSDWIKAHTGGWPELKFISVDREEFRENPLERIVKAMKVEMIIASPVVDPSVIPATVSITGSLFRKRFRHSLLSSKPCLVN